MLNLTKSMGGDFHTLAALEMTTTSFSSVDLSNLWDYNPLVYSNWILIMVSEAKYIFPSK